MLLSNLMNFLIKTNVPNLCICISLPLSIKLCSWNLNSNFSHCTSRQSNAPRYPKQLSRGNSWHMAYFSLTVLHALKVLPLPSQLKVIVCLFTLTYLCFSNRIIHFAKKLTVAHVKLIKIRRASLPSGSHLLICYCAKPGSYLMWLLREVDACAPRRTSSKVHLKEHFSRTLLHLGSCLHVQNYQTSSNLGDCMKFWWK